MHKLRAGLIVSVLAALIAAVSAVPAPGGSAEAYNAKAKPKCPDRALCVWKNPGYEGRRIVVKGKRVSNKIFNKMNDAASSAFLNRNSLVGVLWTDVDGTGDAICLTRENRRRIERFAVYDDAVSSSTVERNAPTDCLF